MTTNTCLVFDSCGVIKLCTLRECIVFCSVHIDYAFRKIWTLYVFFASVRVLFIASCVMHRTHAHLFGLNYYCFSLYTAAKYQHFPHSVQCKQFYFLLLLCCIRLVRIFEKASNTYKYTFDIWHSATTIAETAKSRNNSNYVEIYVIEHVACVLYYEFNNAVNKQFDFSLFLLKFKARLRVSVCDLSLILILWVRHLCLACCCSWIANNTHIAHIFSPLYICNWEWD